MFVATLINFNLFICLKLKLSFLLAVTICAPHIPQCSSEFLSHEPPVCLPPYTVLDPGISMRGAPHSTMYLDVPSKHSETDLFHQNQHLPHPLPAIYHRNASILHNSPGCSASSTPRKTTTGSYHSFIPLPSISTA